MNSSTSWAKTDMLGSNEATRWLTTQCKGYLAVGVIERNTQFGRETLYYTLFYFGPDSQLLGKHRKLKPIAAERLIWGKGDGSILTTINT